MAKAYEVVDAQTAKVVAQFDARDDAVRSADQRDVEYGAVRYRVERRYDVMSAGEFDVLMTAVRTERAQVLA